MLPILAVADIVLNNGVKDGNASRVYLQSEERLCVANYITTIIDLPVVNGHMLVPIY